MELETAIRTRRSIRKFKPSDIDRKVLQEIMETARWSPSWGNTQPWEFYILAGPALEEFKRENLSLVEKGEPYSPEVPMPESWHDQLNIRYGQVGAAMLEALHIARDDKNARNLLYLNMAGFFGAPYLLFLCVPKEIPVEYAMLDVGLVLQNVCLLACSRGLGTCIMAVAVRYPGLVRKYAAIPNGKRLIIGVAIGTPDNEAPVNNFERKRAQSSECIFWRS